MIGLLAALLLAAPDAPPAAPPPAPPPAEAKPAPLTPTEAVDANGVVLAATSSFTTSPVKPAWRPAIS